MKVKSENEVAQSCPTLSDPMDCSLPGFSVHGTFQARVLEWGAIAMGLGKTKRPNTTQHSATREVLTYYFFKHIYLFIWLCWVLVA